MIARHMYNLDKRSTLNIKGQLFPYDGRLQTSYVWISLFEQLLTFPDDVVIELSHLPFVMHV